MRLMRSFVYAALLCLVPFRLCAAIRVAATTEDLASLAKEVGGDFVEVNSIARGYQDPHFVEAKPSYLLKLKRADLFIQVGLELEAAWAPALLINARNPRILPGAPGFLDASEGCAILQREGGTLDRSGGDVHPLGNPHYWLDPANGRVIARNIAGKLAVLDSGHAEDFRKNLALFESRLTEKEKEWDGRAATLKNVKAVTYHNSWPNFAARFGIKVINFIEPKPGIPPSPAHLKSLLLQIRAEKVRLILVEPYFDLKLPEMVARQTGAKLLVIPPSVGGEKDVKSYFDLFDHNLTVITETLESGG